MNAPEALKSPLLERAGFRHAFFTRRGGVSEGPYASLSFSVSVGDHREHVAENLRRAATALGVAPERVYFLSQVHGTACHIADGSEEAGDFLRHEGDAVIALDTHLACGVRTADCVPILVGDRRSGAALAIHAGWRGVVGGVVASAIERLRETLGDAGDLLAAIGPHISLQAFEVSDEVAARLTAASPDPSVVTRRGERAHVDLRRIVHAQLRRVGLSDDAIDHVEGCTVGDPVRFFSYRRDGAKSGRHLSAIVPAAQATR
ncbi:MAG: peptidoglycan editing factor PgeF [Pseudomonadota bacterium]|nr:MAG: peptidoglycan editing factor PgeF [Pseudomonadota bacterium]